MGVFVLKGYTAASCDNLLCPAMLQHSVLRMVMKAVGVFRKNNAEIM